MTAEDMASIIAIGGAALVAFYLIETTRYRDSLLQRVALSGIVLGGLSACYSLAGLGRSAHLAVYGFIVFNVSVLLYLVGVAHKHIATVRHNRRVTDRKELQS